MFGFVIKKLFGTKHNREMKRLSPTVDSILSFEKSLRDLSDSALREKTNYFKNLLAEGKTLDDILPEAFAVVREASLRTTGMRIFDVQMIGGIILHEGKIAEMLTGEGKTLVASLPVYLNALTGKGVHVVTVNDYLAKRDSEWMGSIYRFLGMSVGVIVHGLDDSQRRQAYFSDITYGTNNEFGFDYLRDNMKFRLEDYAQREFNYAIVDEVDSILIDEARTPLIISGPTEESTDKYYIIDQIIPALKKEEDYTLDEKSRSVMLTESGADVIESRLKIENLYDPQHIETLHHVNQALRAHTLFKKDRDYVVKDDEVIIVDEFTGRLMPGRRWSDGLHQAVEAKEKVRIENENQTLATITFQNYFRMYAKLAGMTGTAETEAQEFYKIYKLDVVVIPANKPMIRIDHPDVIYKTEREKFEAAVDEIAELYDAGRPVLVGTVSIDKSEKLSKLLKKRGIPHHVLNAKQHDKEAEIIKNAGQRNAVTISTNMAGRGTDIVLGEGVADLGGLHILGTERHEARRIDNQLRGRAGRQGDGGSSRFYLSLEDDLMRIFASDRIAALMDRLGVAEGEAIEHRWTTSAIETAQRRVEGRNFDIRKQLLKYDDVMNHQRKIIYGLRREILQSQDLSAMILSDAEEMVDQLVLGFTSDKGSQADWDIEGLAENAARIFSVDLRASMKDKSFADQEEFRNFIIDTVGEAYKRKETELTSQLLRYVEKEIKLRSIDYLWKDHLLSMDHLREGIGFEGYAQRDPLLIYHKKGFELFSDMIIQVKENTLERIFKIQIAREDRPSEGVFQAQRRPQAFSMNRGQMPGQAQAGQGTSAHPAPVKREGEKVGRNDPCPCGSGKKDKKCHGR
jgi:preprotein translocase subunit SecA